MDNHIPYVNEEPKKNFFQKIKHFFTSAPQSIRALGILAIVATVPLTVLVAQQQQNLAQHASAPEVTDATVTWLGNGRADFTAVGNSETTGITVYLVRDGNLTPISGLNAGNAWHDSGPVGDLTPNNYRIRFVPNHNNQTTGTPVEKTLAVPSAGGAPTGTTPTTGASPTIAAGHAGPTTGKSVNPTTFAPGASVTFRATSSNADSIIVQILRQSGSAITNAVELGTISSSQFGQDVSFTIPANYPTEQAYIRFYARKSGLAQENPADQTTVTVTSTTSPACNLTGSWVRPQAAPDSNATETINQTNAQISGNLSWTRNGTIPFSESFSGTLSGTTFTGSFRLAATGFADINGTFVITPSSDCNSFSMAETDNRGSRTFTVTRTSPSVSPTAGSTPTNGGIQGDADGNGTVNIADFNIWRDEYLQRDLTRRADFDHDHSVNLVDFNIWRTAYLHL